jgi:hypothetical protein
MRLSATRGRAKGFRRWFAGHVIARKLFITAGECPRRLSGFCGEPVSVEVSVDDGEGGFFVFEVKLFELMQSPE